MGFRTIKIFFCFLCAANLSISASAQVGLCPPNMDFEQGDFSGWICRAGSGFGPFPLPITGPLPGRHTIINRITAGIDPFGSFSEICPNGSGYSMKLGNFQTQSQAESISYTYAIPSTLTNFSMLFYYAIVLENPVGHPSGFQPRFRARIIDVSTNNPLPCVNFDFEAGTTPGGFQTSPFPGHNGSVVLYKDWTPISVNLNTYIGRTIMLEFITNDCLQNGHAGYAYLDVSSVCNSAIQGSTVCIGDTSTTLTAPFGFQNYTWYSDNTFSTIISTSQTVTFNPPPLVGTVYPVIIEPFPGFGCRDTLYATISVSPRPVSNAGPDVTICEGQQVQIGGPPSPGYNYLWTPAGQVTNPIVSNPFAWNIGPPTEFIVRTTDLLTSCVSYDSAIITSFFVDTALQVTGKQVHCAGDPAAGTLSVSGTVSGVQWYDGAFPIPGATGLSYQPTTSGSYWAAVMQSGCTDSTRTEIFTVNPLPSSVAGPDASICTNSQTIQLGAPSNPAYTYSWTPAAQVSNPAIGDPVAWAIGASTTEFIVHTTDPLTGCNTYDTTYISGRVVDTAILLNGKNDFCTSDPAWGTLSVSNAVSPIQWYDGTAPIPGATGFSYRPLTTGNYWAQLQQSGCTDSTATVSFNIHPIPVVSFTASSDSGCVTKHSFLFTNGSTASDGSALSYQWKLGDGTVQTITDAIKTYLTVGNYPVKLITTTAFGCTDSSNVRVVHVVPNGYADFKWDSICINRPVYFYNLSNEKGSVQVNYSWNFNNGGPGSTSKNPLPVIYNTVGQTDVTLILTALGCENDPDTIIYRVQKNIQKPGITYRTITVPEGSTQFIHARDSVGYFFTWRPQSQLSNYHAQYTEFRAVDDMLYQVDISDIHTCVTTDTLQMLVLKKPGYYLPTAFTPNGDGLNDVAIPYLVGMKSLKSFSVFNRWGNLVFYSTREGEGWDGKSKGVTQDSGVYVWILEFINNQNKKITEKGTITIIR